MYFFAIGSPYFGLFHWGSLSLQRGMSLFLQENKDDGLLMAEFRVAYVKGIHL